jgi:SAM-dependent methyltransferase
MTIPGARSAPSRLFSLVLGQKAQTMNHDSMKFVTVPDNTPRPRPGSLVRLHALGALMRGLVYPGCVVLDCGAFDGFLSKMHRNSGAYKTIVIDLDPQGLEIAKQRELLAVKGSLCEAPIGSNAIDVIFCLDVIEHVENDRSVVSEIGRMLRPHCDFRLPLVSRRWLNGRWGHLRNGYSEDTLRDFAAGAGLRILSQGLYFNLLSRLAYSLLFIYRIPPLWPSAKLRLINAITRFEPKVSRGRLEWWVELEKPTA